jgi:hypothetical protein
MKDANHTGAQLLKELSALCEREQHLKKSAAVKVRKGTLVQKVLVRKGTLVQKVLDSRH